MKTTDPELKQNINAISQMIYGNWMQQVTYAFAELGIADTLFEAPQDCRQLAEKLNLQLKYLKRFLRCAIEIGYVEYDSANAIYNISKRGELLSSHHPYSKNAEARLNGSDYRYNPWGNLVHILKNGHHETYSPTLVNGTLEYLKNKPEQLNVFHQAMYHVWRTENDEITKSFDFSPFSTVMDIGCGTGSFLVSILKTNVHLKGIMFDLVDTFDKLIIDNERVTLQAGDFFEKIPDTADLYMMKNVIHNWPEHKAEQLMKNVHRAMTSAQGIRTDPSKKRLLIIENILPDDGIPHISNWMDLNFMVLIDGMERTRKEYKTLGQDCGFKLKKIHKTTTNRDIIEYALL